MPTPVSTFSPFTPFTPACNNHNPGSYFDRPSTTVPSMTISSPLGRRPDIRNSRVGSSNVLRINRNPTTTTTTTTHDHSRQPVENGWKMASRMRDEAWSAWEEQLGNLSSHQTNQITLSSDTLITARTTTHRTIEEPQPRLSFIDPIKTSSNTRRFPSELLSPQMAPGTARSMSSHGPPRPPTLAIKRRSFDPSFSPNHASLHEVENVRVE